MRRRALPLLFALLAWLLAAPLPARTAAEWAGVDEKVVGKVARAAGRSPREPLVDTGRGDLLLFAFLVAGAVGGFVAGYCFRTLFPPGAAKKG